MLCTLTLSLPRSLTLSTLVFAFYLLSSPGLPTLVFLVVFSSTSTVRHRCKLKVVFFISSMLEKEVNVALLSDFWWKKEVKVALLSDFQWKTMFFCRLTILFLVFYGIQMFFFLSFDFRLDFVVIEIKFGFLCDFLWKMRFFLSFNRSVIGCWWNRKGFFVCRLIFVGGWSKV